VIDVRLEHGIVLRPRRKSGMTALDQMERRPYASRTSAKLRRLIDERAMESGGDIRVGEHRIGVIVGQIESIREICTCCLCRNSAENVWKNMNFAVKFDAALIPETPRDVMPPPTAMIVSGGLPLEETTE
jgi:hypothetical protein